MSPYKKKIGVAISTTGDHHRMPFLETSVVAWEKALGELRDTSFPESPQPKLFVTVDGNKEEAERVARCVYRVLGQRAEGVVHRVGQPFSPEARQQAKTMQGDRLGVAANKNTGLELLMEDADVEHLFLSDDDTWPLSGDALRLHTDWADAGLPHSMVCWGKSRLRRVQASFAEWSWPRGVMLYQHRRVVERVGGMDERFGVGGHEHAEFSRRIHQAALTPVDFPTPPTYGYRGVGALRYWHAEDAPRPGEHLHTLGVRRQEITSVHRNPGDWIRINKIMAERDGNTSLVSFYASWNGRASATLVKSWEAEEPPAEVHIESRGAKG